MSGLGSVFDLMRGEHPELVAQRLREVVRWCARTRGPSLALLCPYTDEDVFFSAPDQKEVIAHVAQRRRELLRDQDTDLVELCGRWLCYEDELSLFDGAAEDATGGFFDINNVPVWDYWVALICLKGEAPWLLSWIPEALVSRVTQGIEVNPEQCIFWIDEVEWLDMDVLHAVIYDAEQSFV